MAHDRIAVVDFGGQYAHLITTKVRRLHVLAEIRQPEDPPEAFAAYKGIILSGSPALSALGEDSDYDKGIYDLPVPILGFCFGHQEIAKHYGGSVIHGKPEWGHADLRVLRRDHPLLAGLGETEPVWMSHNDSVTALGPDFEEFGLLDARARREHAHRFAAIGSDSLRPVRIPVPSGGRRHRARRRDDRELRARHLRLFADVDDGAVRRRGDRPDLRAASGTARCSCWPQEAWTRPSPRGCWPRRSARSACSCCTSTTA